MSKSVPRRAGQLSLYEVLDYLKRTHSGAILDELQRETYALACQRESDPLLFYREKADGTIEPGADPFRVDILEHVYDQPHGLRSRSALPMAVTKALAKAADDNGMVDVSRVGQLLGPYAAKIAAQLSANLAHFQRPELPVNTKLEGGDDRTIELVSRSMPHTWGAERMPLLPKITQALGAPDLFEKWRMASLSHLFATRPALYEELERNGMHRSRHLVSGKGYSRNIDVVASMRADGWQIDETLLTGSQHYIKGDTFDERRAYATLSKLFAGVEPGSDQQFLLLDDGANLICALHKFPEFRQYAKQCRVIEQTEHGILRIEKEILKRGIKLLCPVISMARCDLKKKIESLLIGEAVMHSTELTLDEIHPAIRPKPADTEVALIGFGAVNQGTLQALLRRGYRAENIWVWDENPDQRLLAASLGLQTGNRDDVLKHGTLTISATGELALAAREYDLLPDEAIVLNAGSGNHELGMHELDEQQRLVAPLDGGRRYTRLVDDRGQGEPAIDAYVRSALEALADQEAMRSTHYPRTVSVLGYDENARRAIALLRQAGFLPHGFLVSDVDEAQRRRAEADGLKVVDRETALRHGTIVLSDEANVLWQSQELAQLPSGAIHIHHAQPLTQRGPDEIALAREGRKTAAMRDAILDRNEEFFRGYRVNNAIDRAGQSYRHRVLHTGRGSDVLVLRSGYVINMEVGLPPEYAQLILGMLQAACIQATKETEPIIHDLKHQDFIQIHTERYLQEIGRSLFKPDFSGLAPAI